MKEILGLLFIVIIHVLFGVIYQSSFFEEINYFIIIEYSFLLIISLINCWMIHRQGLKIFKIWIATSTIPGLLFMTYARFSDSSGGWISFPWDWGLWELFIPIIYGLIQLIFVAILTAMMPRIKT
ncbi:hypothetical protein SAMN04487895_102286 [Paenibacillus sophorae]|uniref:Uncharacterized protein n=1 Tax=Paenibacillus sophorae TaxID=1333845 RepID=A0A1H8ISU5_9BACL|nr:hypothetical protein [Paenibacillus sophorae]QWU16044.1 hypothetical protein KP014_01815 [Paenibacillus sophorae]SEN70728.1 hypothetical protein SAMN04487895_102286 [Paenibacillus sophorae]